MKRFNCLVGGLMLVGVAGSAEAQTTLAPGDVAVVGFNMASTVTELDSVTLVTFVDLAVGTSIWFTDGGYSPGTGLFRATEGAIELVITTALPAGSVFTITTAGTTGLPDLAIGGDQIFVFQGTLVAGALTGSLLFGVNDDGAGIWQADATTSNNSALPPALVGHDLPLPELDNYAYTGITTGTRAELYAAIRNTSNWTGNNPLPFPARPTMFTILPDAIDGGMPPVIDAGPPDLGPPDLGPPDLGPPDLGPTTIDAGPPAIDLGTPDTDAGTTDIDAGAIDGDAGTTDGDAGMLDLDAGPGDFDMSTPPADLGAADAGSTPPAPRERGACACSTPGSTGGHGAACILLALAVLLPLAGRRRRS